jgi:hypothetical protein
LDLAAYCDAAIALGRSTVLAANADPAAPQIVTTFECAGSY